MSLDHPDSDPSAEYEFAKAYDAQAQALARMDRARQEQAAADAAGYDQPCEDNSVTR